MEYLSMGVQDWDYSLGIIDSGIIGEYTTYFSTHRFPRLTCPDELEPAFDEDVERP